MNDLIDYLKLLILLAVFKIQKFQHAVSRSLSIQLRTNESYSLINALKKQRFQFFSNDFINYYYYSNCTAGCGNTVFLSSEICDVKTVMFYAIDQRSNHINASQGVYFQFVFFLGLNSKCNPFSGFKLNATFLSCTGICVFSFISKEKFNNK